jgi:hypothetical protein
MSDVHPFRSALMSALATSAFKSFDLVIVTLIFMAII